MHEPYISWRCGVKRSGIEFHYSFHVRRVSVAANADLRGGWRGVW